MTENQRKKAPEGGAGSGYGGRSRGGNGGGRARRAGQTRIGRARWWSSAVEELASTEVALARSRVGWSWTRALVAHAGLKHAEGRALC